MVYADTILKRREIVFMFSGLQIGAMALSAVLALGAPVGLLLFWRKKTGAPWRGALVGAAMFFLFALVLEQIPHLLLLRPDGFIMSHTWAYVLYGTLAAGIFEETGRLVGFRFLLRRQSGRETSVMYGIGHGGIESLLLGGVAAVANLAVSLQYNAGTLTGDLLAAVPAALAASPAYFLAIGVERLVTICLHIALSVLVFQAVKRPGKRWLYPAAILLHAGMDVFAALYQRGVITLWTSEALMAAFTALTCVLAFRLYRADVPAAEQV